LFSFIQGNVFAPLFAIADMALVGFCFRAVWRHGEDFDCIRLGSGAVEIESRRGPDAIRVSYLTGWTRVWSEPGRRGDRACVFVGSHGRRTEVGSFLADAERARLEKLIKIRLGQARVGPGHDSIKNVARGLTA
jgi:uncharacterized membrane protein